MDPNFPRVFLDALHPSGQARKVAWFGENRPGETPIPTSRPDGFDAVLLASNPSELALPRALEDILSLATEALAPAGIVLASPPRSGRRRFARAIARQGFTDVSYYLHHKSGSTWLLCPLTAPAIRKMIETWPLSPRWKRIEAILRAVPGTRSLLALALPSIVIVASRDKLDGRHWLHEAAGTPAQPLVGTSWRGSGEGAVAFVMPTNLEQPRVLSKRNSGQRPETTMPEAIALAALGDDARSSGIRVPSRAENFAHGPWSHQTVLPGRTMAMIIHDGNTDVSRISHCFSQAVMNWNLRTRAEFVLTSAMLDRILFEPLTVLEADLGSTIAYRSGIESAAMSLLGKTVNFVAAHNDCSTANILWDDRDGIGLVDWETASAEGLPLADQIYSLCDFAFRTGAHARREEAFLECFVNAGPARAKTVDVVRTWQAASGDDWLWLTVAFHSCWLMHARNEKFAGEGPDRPFLSIVREMANWPALTPPGWQSC